MVSNEAGTVKTATLPALSVSAEISEASIVTVPDALKVSRTVATAPVALTVAPVSVSFG